MPTTLDEQSGLQVVPLFIGGSPVSTGKRFPVHSAVQNKDVYLAESADERTAIAAAEAADKAFPVWRKTTAATRREIICRVTAIIQRRQDELKAFQIEETSCSETWAGFNITYTVNMLKEIAARTTQACSGEVPPMANEDTFGVVLKEPVGPVLLIAPWNAAVILAARSLGSILAAGCTAVFKTSELSPRTHHCLVEIFIEAGVPADVISVIQTSRQDAPTVTEALIGHKAIKKVEFIGSAAVGRIIGSFAGRYLKPVLMELGGKCVSIVLEDADLEAAATKTVNQALIHHGQVCFSTERIVVMQSVADQFIALIKDKAMAYQQGSGVNTNIVNNSYNFLVDAKEKGATFILGEPQYCSETSLQVALLTGVNKTMKMWDEESFGPSATVIIVKNDAELVEVVNESSYGLDAFLHTKDMKRALAIARQLEVGRVRVNNPAHEPTFPTNPVKGSGWGRNNAAAGIEEFLHRKVVTMDFRE
ncbi:hypothetical protein H2200_003230 [Cladophialophora chaetospira]|uniref:Aldehyde dehydrogenase domain-containing protein n=1 Tax=Cladophialophora chaetospira TaxID=386627 RepID=A0AA38XGY5_9EURO|nr:hypothetical protein H2200_003230 [Cladophialophora chaetospira]